MSNYEHTIEIDVEHKHKDTYENLNRLIPCNEALPQKDTTTSAASQDKLINTLNDEPGEEEFLHQNNDYPPPPFQHDIPYKETTSTTTTNCVKQHDETLLKTEHTAIVFHGDLSKTNSESIDNTTILISNNEKNSSIDQTGDIQQQQQQQLDLQSTIVNDVDHIDKNKLHGDETKHLKETVHQVTTMNNHDERKGQSENLTCYLSNIPSSLALLEHDTLQSYIPEKDTVFWQIKDFAAFLSAAKVSNLPPLVSPEFGTGCFIHLQLYDKKGHVSGYIEVSTAKAVKNGVMRFKISVVKPDLKAILSRKINTKILIPQLHNRENPLHKSTQFRLTRPTLFGSPKTHHLVINDSLHIRIDFQYFPFDAPIFRRSRLRQSLKNLAPRHVKIQNEGIKTMDWLLWEECERKSLSSETPVELLCDIRDYCREDPNQYVEIRRDESHFQACRFLLSARSSKFRSIFKGPNNPTRHTSTPSLSSITVRDISAKCLAQLLAYIHTNTCQWFDEETDMIETLELLEASQIYGIEALRQRLILQIKERLSRDNLVHVLEMAEKCNDTDVKKICTEFMDSIPGSEIASLMRSTS